MSFQTIDPSTGKGLRTYARMTEAEVTSTVAAAHNAFGEWRQRPLSERTPLLGVLADVLERRKQEWAALMTAEMGKPLREAVAEIEKCAWVCQYYADNAETQLDPRPAATDAQRSYVSFEPQGLVLAIMPWNFPFWQVLRFAAPTIAAGNGALLKHAPNTFGCAEATESLFREAGFPEHLFRSLYIDVDQVESVIADPRVRAVTLTGSGRAGRAVAALAGTYLKKTVLELGGSDASVVLEDANLDAAAESIVASRLINSGQSCIAAKRFIPVASVHDAFVKRVMDRMHSAVMGDPTDERTTIGPLAREDLRDTLHEQVRRSVSAGARCLLGGEVPDRAGWFYPPTLLVDVRPGMPAFDEEMFGPVAAIVRAQDEEDAIALANRSSFGLGAAVYTSDVERGARIAQQELDAGACFVNGMVRSDPRLPFGGVKESGYGRELSAFGIHEFVNVKTVWVE